MQPSGRHNATGIKYELYYGSRQLAPEGGCEFKGHLAAGNLGSLMTPINVTLQLLAFTLLLLLTDFLYLPEAFCSLMVSVT